MMNFLRGTTFVFLLFLCACQAGRPNSSDYTPQVAPPHPVSAPEILPATSAEPHWSQLRYSTHCDSADPSRCLGYYGFTIYSSGFYEVGPSPGGDVLVGVLEEMDLERLRAQLSRALRDSPPEQSPECGAEIASGLSEGLSILQDGIEKCIRLGAQSTDSVWQSVSVIAHSLAEKHYPDIFPSPCTDAAAAFHKKYEALRGCAEDSDCAYIDLDFVAVGADQKAPVLTDDCSYINPLVVGNALEVTTRQLELLIQRELARKVCRSNLHRKGCIGTSGFFADGRTPRCIAGQCRLAPEVKSIMLSH